MANPSAEEQYMLELVNRMRMNPAAEENLLVNSSDPNVNSAITSFGVDLTELSNQWSTLTAVQPVAWSSLLEDSATIHSELMIVQDTQSHQLSGEPSLGDRVNAIGYSWNAVGENIFAFSESIFHGHAGLAIDWGSTSTGIQQPPGHRENMMNNNFREVGIAVVPEDDPATSVGPLVITQVFGNRAALENGSESWLLGSVIRDVDDDNFYSIGEGLDDVTVNITGTGTTSFSGSTNTLSAGGYQILLQDGTYQVDFVRDGAVFETQNVTINGENEKVDAVIDAAPAPSAGKAKIVGNKWNDLNGDGIWDSNEAGLSGWTIYLDTNGNRQLDVGEVSTTTDANGEYVFNDIDPGTYNVAEVLQSGWVQTNPDPSNPIGSEAYQLDDGELDRYRGGFTDGGGNSLELLALNTFDTQTGLETID
ncbi:MAG: SdrD B-like domain-containing protein, partial [Cyanobacteria bacterium J06641_2]